MNGVTEVLAACRDWAAEQWRVEITMAAIRGAERQARLADWLGGWAATVTTRLSGSAVWPLLAAEVALVFVVWLIGSGRLVSWGRLACMWLSALFTVVWDPFSASTDRILLWGTFRYWRHGPDEFAVACSYPRGRRFAAWMYRWHREPTPDDWALWSRRLETPVPPHTLLLFRDGHPLGHGIVVRIGAHELVDNIHRIVRPDFGAALTERSVKFITIRRSELARKFGVYDAGTCEGGTYNTSFSYVDSEAPERLGPIRRGGLAPERLIADSKPPHGDVYGVCKSPRKVA